MNKRILLISEYFYPHWTGIAKAFYFFAEDLIKQGHSVTVLTTRFNISLPEKEKELEINIIRAPYTFKISRTHYSFPILFKFLSIIRQYNTIIINSPNSNILFFAFFSKLFNKKLIIFHQGDIKLPRKTGNIIVNWLIERIFDLMTIPAMFLADQVSTYTKDYAQNSRVMHFFLDKFKAYIPPIKLNPKKTSSSARQFKQKLASFKKKHILIGFAGRFVEEKGFDILLEAIPLVKKTIPNALFIFAGETKMGYEKFYETNFQSINRLKGSIKMLGLLNDAELTHFYKSLSLFVVASRSDCFPLTQIEAAKLGVPIVTTNIAGARMLVKETGFGAIAEPENPKSLAENIINVINNKNKLQKNRRNVTEFFSRYVKLPICHLES